jgi:hypothetical protein
MINRGLSPIVQGHIAGACSALPGWPTTSAPVPFGTVDCRWKRSPGAECPRGRPSGLFRSVRYCPGLLVFHPLLAQEGPGQGVVDGLRADQVGDAVGDKGGEDQG